jgi:hypothetical protein
MEVKEKFDFKNFRKFVEQKYDSLANELNYKLGDDNCYYKKL